MWFFWCTAARPSPASLCPFAQTCVRSRSPISEVHSHHRRLHRSLPVPCLPDSFVGSPISWSPVVSLAWRHLRFSSFGVFARGPVAIPFACIHLHLHFPCPPSHAMPCLLRIAARRVIHTPYGSLRAPCASPCLCPHPRPCPSLAFPLSAGSGFHPIPFPSPCSVLLFWSVGRFHVARMP